MIGLLVLAALQAASSFELARDVPVGAGTWTYRATPTGSEARFGFNFIVQCERASWRVSLRRIEPIRFRATRRLP